MFFTVIKIWLKHDWQRPASWVSLCLAGCAVMTIPKMTIPGGWGLPLFFWGVLASAAAIGMGEVFATLPLWSFRSHARKWAFGSFTRSVSALPHGLSWYVVRLLWPTIGCVSGLIVKAIVGQNDQVQQATLLLEGIVIIVLTAGTFFTFLVSGFPIADAYSGVLLTGWSAIAIVGWSFSCMPPWLIWAVPFILVMVWLGAGLVLLLLGTEVFSSSYPDIFGSILLRNEAAARPSKENGFSSIAFLGILPVQSPWRRTLRIIAIVSLLVAMVGWLLLTSSDVPRYEILASIVFGAIAIPSASLLDGHKVVSEWDCLLSCRRRARWLERLTTPNRIFQAGIVLVSYGAIVSWPPLVVSLAAVGSSGAGSGLQAVGFLTVIGAITLIACLFLQRAKARTETVFAFSLAVFVMGVWGTFLLQQSLFDTLS